MNAYKTGKTLLSLEHEGRALFGQADVRWLRRDSRAQRIEDGSRFRGSGSADGTPGYYARFGAGYVRDRRAEFACVIQPQRSHDGELLMSHGVGRILRAAEPAFEHAHLRAAFLENEEGERGLRLKKSGRSEPPLRDAREGADNFFERG